MIAKTLPEHEITSHFHSEQKHIKIIHVGAGAAGLITAYKAGRILKNYALTCYEKNKDVGGTWLENNYPGVGCDVPSHSYTFSFESNPEWNGFYANGDQIQKYFTDFCEKHDLRRFIKFDTRVMNAVWLEEGGEWELDLLRGDGVMFQDRCHVLINGSGPLNRWKWPHVEGIKNFKGQMVHTAEWDSSTKWQGKRVALIGSGASGVQITPQLVKGSSSFTLYTRTAQWITPGAGMQDIRIIPNSDKSAHPAAAGKHFYSEEEKHILRTDATRFLEYRKAVDSAMQERFPIFFREGQMHDIVRQMITDMVKQRIGPGRPDLEELFIPDFSPGCRRNTPGEGFLEALKEPHVECVRKELVRFTEKGIITEDGKEREFDLIVCATGFDVAFAPHFKVIGRNGISMQEDWDEFPNVYLSVAAPNMPNFYFIGGPTGNWAQGSVLFTHEVQSHYALLCALKISTERLHSLSPSQSMTTQWIQHVETWHRTKSVFAEECRSWMKWKGRVQLWSGSMLHMMKTLERPRWEDYEIQPGEGNIWGWLGDGTTERERKAGEVAMKLMIRGEKAKKNGEGMNGGTKVIEDGMTNGLGEEDLQPVDLSPWVRTSDDEPWSIDL